MAPTAVDTSLLIAALQSWHSHHERARRALDDALSRPPVVVPQHVLIESYAVMTRLPAPHRLSPATALDLLRQTLEDVAEPVVVEPGGTWDLLSELSADGVAGGSTYDALVAAAAVRAGAKRILTLNRRHFERIAPPGLEVVVPGEGIHGGEAADVPIES